MEKEGVEFLIQTFNEHQCHRCLETVSYTHLDVYKRQYVLYDEIKKAFHKIIYHIDDEVFDEYLNTLVEEGRRCV